MLSRRKRVYTAIMLHSRLAAPILGALVLFALAGFEAHANGGPETGSVREVRGFDSVSFATSGRLLVTQGDQESLEVLAGASELPDIVTEVRGTTLFIGRKGSGPAFSLRPPEFRLTMKRVAGLAAHSSGRIEAGGLRAGTLRIEISSSGGVSLESLDADSLEVRISSSGSVRVAGRVQHQDIHLSSSGSYLAGNLASSSATVRVSSSGGATLRVSDSLEADLTSSGGVRYYGKAPRVEANVTSSGRLVRLGD
jgi:hypothetical protein